jgi:hypothetical protein
MAGVRNNRGHTCPPWLEANSGIQIRFVAQSEFLAHITATILYEENPMPQATSIQVRASDR